MKNQAIGIMGGSFDPIHLGHLQLASYVQAYYKLSQILFIPCHQNPLKTFTPNASAQDRIRMIELAIAPCKHFSIDLREIQNTASHKPSYTVNTLQSLRQEYPKTPLAFLMAWDTFERLMEWKDWEQLLHYTHLVITTRPGYFHEVKLPKALAFFLTQYKTDQKNLIHTALNGYIFFQTLPPLSPIASSDIRKQAIIKAKLSQWVPFDVEQYIYTHQVYKVNKKDLFSGT